METVRVVRARDRIALLGALRLALGLVLAVLALTRVGRDQLVLGCGALVSDSRLTPLLAGILVGMALTTFASLGQITSDERVRRHRIYMALDAPPRTFVVPVAPVEPDRDRHA